jgi:hypothetical protein
MAISEEVIRKVLNITLMTEEVKKAQECSDCLSKTIERLIEIMKDPEEQAKLEEDLKDGDMEFDDKGVRCYWDAEEQDWVASAEYASPRFLAVLKERDDFEGFEDPDISDEEEEEEECYKKEGDENRKVFSITDITHCWRVAYGENIADEYEGFVERLWIYLDGLDTSASN